MKKILLITGLCSLSVACAESTRTLPPITNNSTYANGTPYSGAASSNQSMLEMLGRVESLQTEIHQLRGLVEQQSYEIDSLKKRQQNSYVDINERLQQLEALNGTTNSTSEHKNVVTPVSQSQAPSLQSKAGEKAAFDKAFASVKNSQYQKAITLFKQFLLDYPTGEYSDNAIFWLASVYKVVNDLPEAKTNFQLVYTQFPDSEKAGMAMLKLADIYLEENNQQKAKQLYTQITAQYPNTTPAHMAAKKLQNMGQ